MADSAAEPLAPVAESDELPKTKVKLEELSQAASIHYSTKNFAAAAESYADAVQIQAELNGEMAPENADLLFYYGRALYKVAVAKSDVLGNKVAQEDKKKAKPKKTAKAEADQGSSAPSAAVTAKPTQKDESVESQAVLPAPGRRKLDRLGGRRRARGRCRAGRRRRRLRNRIRDLRTSPSPVHKAAGRG